MAEGRLFIWKEGSEVRGCKSPSLIASSNKVEWEHVPV